MYGFLENYKSKKEKNIFIESCYNLAFCSIDAYLSEPTEEEYETIARCCVDAYMESEDIDLIAIADYVSMKYADKELTLDRLRNMSRWEIIDMVTD